MTFRAPLHENCHGPPLGLPGREQLRRALDGDMPHEESNGGDSLLVSLVVPVFNEEAVLSSAVEQILAAAEAAAAPDRIELILVDDGSTDGSWQSIVRWSHVEPRVVGIRLSRNFGQQAAILCGYAAAAGEAVLSLDADLQDPPHLFAKMIEAWRSGADVVFAVRASRGGEGGFKRATAWLYYRLLSLISDGPVILDAGEFRLLSRRALEALLAIVDADSLLRAAASRIGFPSVAIKYHRASRQAGRTKYGLRKMLGLAANGIFATPRGPAHLAHGCAAASLVTALTLGACAALFPAEPSSLPERLASAAALGAVVIAMFVYLGFILEYVARIHRRLSDRPAYIVQEIARFHDAEQSKPRV